MKKNVSYHLIFSIRTCLNVSQQIVTTKGVCFVLFYYNFIFTYLFYFILFFVVTKKLFALHVNLLPSIVMINRKILVKSSATAELQPIP